MNELEKQKMENCSPQDSETNNAEDHDPFFEETRNQEGPMDFTDAETRTGDFPGFIADKRAQATPPPIPKRKKTK